MRKLNSNFEEVLESSLEYGVPLSRAERTIINRKLEALKESLPIHSNIELSFSSKGIGLSGELSIRTLNNHFIAKSTGIDSLMIYNSLEDQIKDKVLTWKRNRFLPSMQRSQSLRKTSTFLQGGN